MQRGVIEKPHFDVVIALRMKRPILMQCEVTCMPPTDSISQNTPCRIPQSIITKNYKAARLTCNCGLRASPSLNLGFLIATASSRTPQTLCPDHLLTASRSPLNLNVSTLQDWARLANIIAKFLNISLFHSKFPLNSNSAYRHIDISS